MTEVGEAGSWGKPDERAADNPPLRSPNEREGKARWGDYKDNIPRIHENEGLYLWDLAELEELKGTGNLDDQDPETLYFLEKVADIPSVVGVYVEHRGRGKRKHWTVISERDFDVMDKIYNIEHDVLDRFPGTDIQFRVTVDTDGGPSIASKAYKIYEAN